MKPWLVISLAILAIVAWFILNLYHSLAVDLQRMLP